MYNLNDVLVGNCTPGRDEFGMLTIENDSKAVVAAATPTATTPEILNTVLSLMNPLDRYASELSPSPTDHTSADTCSSSTSSNIDSPTSPTSVQSITSKLIKEGLKHTLWKKRRNTLSICEQPPPDIVATGNASATNSSSHRSEDGFDSEEDDNSTNGDFGCGNQGLTPEDEERRQRRRERNKIAATKCRQKKREKTLSLAQESEVLETQNEGLKTQISELKEEKKRLIDMLTVHKPTCSKPSPEQSPIYDYQQPPCFQNCNSVTADTADTAAATVAAASSNCKSITNTNFLTTASYNTRENENRSKVNVPSQPAVVSSENTTAFPPNLFQLEAFEMEEFVKNPSVKLCSESGIDFGLRSTTAASSFNAKYGLSPYRYDRINSSCSKIRSNVSTMMQNFSFAEHNEQQPYNDTCIPYTMDGSGSSCTV